MATRISESLHRKPVSCYSRGQEKDYENLAPGFSDCCHLLALGEGFAGAQQTRKVPRIGYLGLNDPYSSARRTAEIIFESFRQGLREVGYIEGQNIIIERRFAFGDA